MIEEFIVWKILTSIYVLSDLRWLNINDNVLKILVKTVVNISHFPLLSFYFYIAWDLKSLHLRQSFCLNITCNVYLLYESSFLFKVLSWII